MTPRVFVVGAGRAGRALAHAMRVGGVDVVGMHGRRAAIDITHGAYPPALTTASAVLVTVRDAELNGVLRDLLSASIASDAVVLHASGTSEPPSLDELRAQGHACGTFHPLLPLTDPTRATEQLKRAWIGIDGDERARVASRELAAAIGARVVEIPAGEKARYHAAAVIASNFPVVLLAMATQLLTSVEIPDDAARGALGALLTATAENLGAMTPAAALTGPVARGDADTVRSHLVALADAPEILEMYRVMSRAAIPIAIEGGAEKGKLEELSRLLAEG
jgi:predicted short-subunit dehydrogenase-like oxidoreductase (DUF2520 family)